MGKHSRRKAGKATKSADDKKAHKERQKERRQRTIEALDQNDTEGGDSSDNNNNNNASGGKDFADIIDVGDRVRYSLCINQLEWKWGVIHALLDRGDTEEDPIKTFSVLPWQAAEDGQESSSSSLVRVRHALSIDINGQHKRVFPMIEKRQGLWTLRFSIGDQVFCQSPSTLNDRNQAPWRAATVDRLWQRWYDEERFDQAAIECYRCTDDKTGEFIFVMNDTDDDIVALEDTILRFSKGQRVVFKTKTERWVQGNVVSTIVGREEQFCAGYSVRLDGINSRALRCVWKDTDEWIASADAGPRQRLFDAIDQNCSYAHLNHLVTTSNLDVSSFRDLIISRAIKACSHNALAWIQDSMKVDLHKIRDANGNGLLHQISALPKAARFFERAAYITDEEPGRLPMFSITNNRDFEGLILQLDRRGRTFLHPLVTAGNIRALDLALTPDGRFAWDLALALNCYLMKESSSIEALPSFYTRTRDEQGTNVHDAAKLLGRHDMVKIIEDFAKWQTAYELASSLQYRPAFDKIKANILPKFGGISNAAVIRKLRHILRSEGSHFLPLPSICCNIVSNGNLPLLSWLVEGDPALLQISSTEERTTANVNEFAQPELFDTALDSGQCESMGLVSLAAHGATRTYVATAEARKFYASHMLSGFLFCSSQEDGLAAYIKKQAVERRSYLEYRVKGFLDYKVRLLSDDEFLSQRLEMLEYLKDKGHPLPNVLDIIRWRQCGVLRWMVNESYVDLTRPVVDVPSTFRFVEKVHFLGGGPLPELASVGVFLCFAAVEYDDLQSFEWLTSEQNISVTMARCNGWNLLHACAYFGRTEIARTIFQRVVHSDGVIAANQFISEHCDREEYRNLYAPHIAARQGYIQLADFLLSSWYGCPQQDKNGRSIYWHAKRSNYEFVKEWGERNEQSMKGISRLEKDIKALNRLLAFPDDTDNVAKAMDHISKSRCLDIARWVDLELGLSNPGPLGKSYRDVLEDCCNTRIADFIIWLCHTLTPSWSCTDLTFHFYTFWGCHSYSYDRSGQMVHEALLTFARERNNDRLAVCLGKRWTREIRCHDPSETNPLFKEIMKHLGENVSVATGMMKLRDSMVVDELSFRVLSLGSDKVVTLLARTAPLHTITEVLDCMQEVAKDVDDSLIPDLDRWMFSADAAVDVDCYLPCDYSADNHALKNHSLFFDKAPGYLSAAYLVFAVENCEELIRWSLSRSKSSGWDTEKELTAIRIAAYLQHQNIVDLFLQNYGELSLSSTLSERREAALLGALEGGFVDEIDSRGLLPSARQSDFSNFERVLAPVNDDTLDVEKGILGSSLVGVAVFGCLALGNDRGLTTKNVKALKWVASNTGIEPVVFLRAAILVHRDIPYFYNYVKFVDMFKLLIKFGLNPFCCQKEITCITERIVSNFHSNSQEDEYLDELLLQEWLALLVTLGSDIQSVRVDRHYYSGSDDRHESFLRVLLPLQAEQLRVWSKFNIARTKGSSLEAIQEAVVSGDLDLASYDSNGLKLVHLVAAYDRVDLLEWLVEANPMQLDEVDGSGRSVLKVAIASNATNASLWISQRKAAAHFFVRCVLNPAPTCSRRSQIPSSSCDCYTGVVSRLFCTPSS